MNGSGKQNGPVRTPGRKVPRTKLRGTEETTFRKPRSHPRQRSDGRSASKFKPSTNVYRAWLRSVSCFELPSVDSGSALALGRGLRGLGGRRADRLEVGFGDVAGLLDSLLHAFERVVRSGDSRLHERNGVFGAGRGVLHGAVHDSHELRL